MNANKRATARSSPRSEAKRPPRLKIDARRALRTDLAALDRASAEPDDETPELTDEQLARGVLHIGGVPVRRGRPPKEVTKQAVNLRLDPDVVEHFRAGGPGWQTRINDALRGVVKRARSR